VKADEATRIQEALTQAGVKTWTLGIVESNDCSLEGYIQGAKGVDGGAVRLVGKHLP
jgi:phosphoribosylformylglycinamidine cyclo-ligase